MSRDVIRPQSKSSVKINIIVGFINAESSFSVAGQFVSDIEAKPGINTTRKIQNKISKHDIHLIH